MHGSMDEGGKTFIYDKAALEETYRAYLVYYCYCMKNITYIRKKHVHIDSFLYKHFPSFKKTKKRLKIRPSLFCENPQAAENNDSQGILSSNSLHPIEKNFCLAGFLWCNLSKICLCSRNMKGIASWVNFHAIASERTTRGRKREITISINMNEAIHHEMDQRR